MLDNGEGDRPRRANLFLRDTFHVEGETLIGRLWKGWTAAENADAYEELLRKEVLPGIHRIEGYRGAYALRREVSEGAEFVTLTLWDSIEAVRRFAGEDYTAAVVPEEAQALLARFDRTSTHYEVVLAPD